MNIKDTLKSYDYVLALAVIALGVFGVLMIYASGNAASTPPFTATWSAGFWRSQRVFVITGALLMIGIGFVDYRFIARFYWYIYALMMVLLVLVMIFGGQDATGTARWFRLVVPGLGQISIQPSEFAKVFIAIYLAKLLDVQQDKFNHILRLAPIMLSVALPVILVAGQPSLSAAMVIGFIVLTVLFTGGLYYRTIIIALLVLIPILAFVWLDLNRAEPLFMSRILEGYQLVRLQTALDPAQANPDAVRQAQQSLFAVGTGGLTGLGFMNQPFVTHAYNDFIFAIIASQFGFTGAAAVLGALALVIIKCIFIALRAEDMTGRLIAAGVAGMLIFETFVHVGVVVGLLPVTGMPLPFISYGGSMLWGHFIAMGLVLNIKLPRKKSIFNGEEL